MIMAKQAEQRKQQISLAKHNINSSVSARQTGLSRFSNEEGMHFYSPKVEKSINHYFTQKEKIEMDKRVVQELLAEEQERALQYLKSAPRKRI